MSGTTFNYKISLKDVLAKIDKISTQMTKIKRIVNKNNIILKNFVKQPEYVFATIPLLTEEVKESELCEDFRNKDEFCQQTNIINHKKSGNDVNVLDPAQCAFHTVMKNGSDAGSNEMPGSELDFIHGTNSDKVGNLIEEQTKPDATYQQFQGLLWNDLPIAIDMPTDDASSLFNESQSFKEIRGVDLSIANILDLPTSHPGPSCVRFIDFIDDKTDLIVQQNKDIQLNLKGQKESKHSSNDSKLIMKGFFDKPSSKCNQNTLINKPCPSGQSIVPEEKRVKMVDDLNELLNDVNNEIQRLPQKIETTGMGKDQKDLQIRRREIKDMIKTYSQKLVQQKKE